MGFFDSLIKGMASAGGTGSASLSQAAEPSRTDNRPGAYLLILDGDIKKAGSAEIGIQKRMQQYYDLNRSCGLNGKITTENRDRIRVKWQYCSKEQCNELESKLNDKYENSNSMEWSERRPHSSRDTVQLKI
jgi:hypothetical protein